MNTWLVVDANYLCRRAYHTKGMAELCHGDVYTGVVYGFLNAITELQKQHGTDRFIFCFDHGLTWREREVPGYKKSRREKTKTMTPEELKSLGEFRRQVCMLKEKYLRRIGYRNVFYAEGYEADDIIATTVAALPPTDRAIIISTDHDLWQLLGPRVSNWNPQAKRFVTYENFKANWGMEPPMFARVKAIAGCGSDDVPGVAGVGEKTAAKFVRGECRPGTAAHTAITAAKATIIANMKLVRLPYPNTPTFALLEDEVTQEGWLAVAQKLGFASMTNKGPAGVQRRALRGFGL